MKIAVTGKGGVGKTTIAATLARLYAEEGHPVLAADVDPDANLGLALGFPEEILDSIIPITKMRKLIEERTEASADNRFYKINPRVSDIPDKYSKEYNGVKLLTLGTVETAGSGCVCPEHVMLRRIINSLVLHRGDVVILDMEAGLEHLGRGTTEGMDMFIVVIEPGARSIQTYKNVKRLAEELGVHQVHVVANKYATKKMRHSYRMPISAAYRRRHRRLQRKSGCTDLTCRICGAVEAVTLELNRHGGIHLAHLLLRALGGTR